MMWITMLITAASLTSWPMVLVITLTSMPFLATMLYKPILSPIFISQNLAYDSLSSSLILLTSWIMGLALAMSTYTLHQKLRSGLFLKSSIILGITLMLSFYVTNMASFYFLFEATLLPILILILGWGASPERLQAGLYIIIYTVSASLPLLMGLLYVMNSESSLFMFGIKSNISSDALLIMSLAFLVKFPLYGLHLWLPKAHVEAPVGGSMLLAGLLLKLGPYGIYRMMNMFTNYYKLSPLLTTWGLTSALMTSLICMRQTDLKALVAYASISHMGLVLAGLMSFTHLGSTGAMFMMLGHGLASSGLFALVWMVYEWTKSRSLIVNRGMAHAAPGLMTMWFLLMAGNVGIPPSLTMGAEVLLYSSLVTTSNSPFILMVLIIFSALSLTYSLTLYTSLNHGEVSPHMNFMWQRSIYYTISVLHIIPLIMSFFAMQIIY